MEDTRQLGADAIMIDGMVRQLWRPRTPDDRPAAAEVIAATRTRLGGAVIAVFSMMMLWVAGSGFWTPLNLIAHTFWRAAPLDGTFSAAALTLPLPGLAAGASVGWEMRCKGRAGQRGGT